MARGVQEPDLDLADEEEVIAGMSQEALAADTRRALDPGGLVLLDVDRDGDELEESGDAGDVVAEEVAADVIGVVVGGEDAGESHAVGLEHLDDLARGIGRVDRDGFTAHPVADQVDEVHHLAGERITLGEVATGEELAEVQAVVGHDSRGSGDQSASLASRRSFEKTSTIGSRRPMRRCSRSMASSWSHRTSVTATPPSPARAVRPDRCR